MISNFVSSKFGDFFVFLKKKSFVEFAMFILLLSQCENLPK